MTSEKTKKDIQANNNNIETVSEYQQKQIKNKRWRIIIPILIALVIVGLYLLKNPIGTPAESTEFDLDATINFDLDKILSYGLPVIIDFGADSCVPCKLMAPILVELNNELRGKAIIKFVDVSKNNKAAAGMQLEVIPTQFFYYADGTPYVPTDGAAAKYGFIMYQRRDTGEHVLTAHQGALDKEAMLEILKEMGME
jgi:thioredoxin 1